MNTAALEGAGVVARSELAGVTREIFEHNEAVDMHTHLFAPRFGKLGLWGIDHLLTYHYLEAELFRHHPISPEKYWNLSHPAQADLIWKTLFVDNAPISEAARGVVFVLDKLGLDASARSLDEFRRYFAEQDEQAHIERVFRLSAVRSVVMTNDPLDPEEIPFWKQPLRGPGRFHAAIRLDRLLNQWEQHYGAMAGQGYRVHEDLSGRTLAEVRRFLDDWAARMQAVYMAVSLPASFLYPDSGVRHQLLSRCVLPACRDSGLPLALMIGVRRQVNPALRLAGDGLGRADLTALERICLEFPSNRFLVSVLSRENQHELCVLARKFRNLLPFGCWWFLNNSSIVEEITQERLEMLGASFIAQNSDARVLEQLIYKWHNARRTIAPLVAAQFERLADDGRAVRREEIQAVAARLLRGNYERFTGSMLS